MVDAIHISPSKFYALVDLIKTFDKSLEEELNTKIEGLSEDVNELDRQCEDLRKANSTFITEANSALRSRVSKFDSLLDQNKATEPFRDLFSGNHFLYVAYDIAKGLQEAYKQLLGLLQDLRPPELTVSDERFDYRKMSGESIQRLNFEMALNEGSISTIVDALRYVRLLGSSTLDLLRGVLGVIEGYHRKLLERHSVEGVKIHGDPIITDVAITIYENVDAHGEIQEGKNPDEVSAYSVMKAKAMAEAVRSGLAGKLVENSSAFIDFITENVRGLWDLSEQLWDIYGNLAKKTKKIVDPYGYEAMRPSYEEMEVHLQHLETLDPQVVKYRDKETLLSPTERYTRDFKNETLYTLTRMIRGKGFLGYSKEAATPQELVSYILARKQELHKFFQEENSFYTCKIGTGNTFKGESPGGLEVVPAVRPVVHLDEIVGGGFEEVKEFIGQVHTSAKFYDLFTATSPSRTADKSNVLLIGPMGCGKSEILRAVGGDGKSISIYASGSDFNTCWMGEASKNPKRMFEAGIKIHKESKKHVHFLIDEIDSVLNDDRHNAGYINLTLEFQQLMDGVVHYPSLSVWGTTNNPERIPMPMIRRFSKVVIVGELEQEHRIHLLQHFCEFMPVKEFEDSHWEEAATRLEGATGDVIRKVVDMIWRRKMTSFTEGNISKALEMVDQLNKEEKFEVGRFKKHQRAKFKRSLEEHVWISPKDLDESITFNLENVAVHGEIQKAIATYKNAKEFVQGLRESRK